MPKLLKICMNRSGPPVSAQKEVREPVIRSGANVCNILVGCTGCVEIEQLPELLNRLKEIKLDDKTVDLKIIFTECAKKFIPLEVIRKIAPVYTDEHEWAIWKKMGDPVLHIELRKWADVFLIAPLGANTLAKIANGLCDNLLTCVARAWDQEKPFLFCSPMNSLMTEKSITALHTALLTDWGFIEVPCTKELSESGEAILKGMANTDMIAGFVTEALVRARVMLD